MAGEEQERFEDYLELERYIEDLQAGRRASPPNDLAPGQARIYRMAALFRSASPEAATPRPEFMEELHARLLALDKEQTELAEEEALTSSPGQNEHQPELSPMYSSSPLVPTIEHTVTNGDQEKSLPAAQKPVKKRLVSRRSLLTGGAVAAASLAAGAGISTVIQQGGEVGTTPPSNNTPTVPLVMKDTPAGWLFVGTLEQLNKDVLRFATNTIIGFVVPNKGERQELSPSESPILAMSAACTHMGCILQWQKEQRQFLCPCHEGLFTVNGRPFKGKTSSFRYYASLPLLETKIEDGNIYVQVPTYTAIQTT